MANDPTHRQRYNAVVDLILRQAEDDAQVTTAMGRARELRDIAQAEAMLDLDDAQLRAMGWTREGLIIARDARLPKNGAPFYLHGHQERHNTRLRVAGEAAALDTTQKKAVSYYLPVAATTPQLPPQEIDAEDLEDGT